MSRAASPDEKFGQPGANSEWRKHQFERSDNQRRSFSRTFVALAFLGLRESDFS
jgi:hypothetical protein